MQLTSRSILLAPALLLVLVLSARTDAQSSGTVVSGEDGLGGRGIVGASMSIVLDSTVIRLSAARTLADLLSGRVAGINVTYSTGAPGFAPEVTTRGAATLFGNARPSLYIDGILQREDPHALGPLPDGNKPAHEWSLPVAEIESVEIILGPAAGTLFEYGTPRGAILVRTRRPVAGHLALRSFVETLALVPGMSFPDIVTTVATTGANTNWFCTLDREAMGSCTPTGQRRWKALGGDSPLRTGFGTRAGMSTSGGSQRRSFRLSALGDQGAGQIANSGFERIDLAASVAGRAREGLELSIDARHTRSAGEYVRWGENGLFDVGANILPNNGSGAPPNTALMDSTLAHSLPYRTSRTTLGFAASWRLIAGLRAFTRFGSDHVTRESALAEVTGCLTFPTDCSYRRTSNRLDQTSTGGTVGVRGARALRRDVRVSGEAGVHISVLDRQEWSADSSWRGSASSFNRRAMFPDVRSRSTYGAARLDFTPTRFVAGGIRSERSVLSRWEPKDAPFRTAELGWTLSGEPFFPKNAIVTSLQLHAAYGETGDHESDLAASLTSAFVTGPEIKKWGRIVSREVSADATIADGAVTVRATAFDRSVGDALVPTDFPPSAGFFSSAEASSWATHGVEITLSPREIAIGSARWHSALSFSTAQSRLTRFRNLVVAPQYWARVKFEQGAPIGTIHTYRYTWADADSDGVIVPSEITRDADLTRRGVARPTRLLGLTSSLTWSDHLAAGIAIDGKGGHVKADVTNYTRCLEQLCRANYDPATPLAEQAAAVAGVLTSPVYDATFVRVRELWVRYTLPSRLVPRGVRGATVSVAAHQLATWTRYPSGDPETGAFAEGNVQQGDRFSPRVPRTFSIRLDLAP